MDSPQPIHQPPPNPSQAKLAEMLAEGHQLLRGILDTQVDYYKVRLA